MLRRSPLTRKTPLRSGGWLKRTVAKVRRPRDTGPDTATKIRLTLRSGGICERCGRADADAVHRHHRRPRRLGGSKDPLTNLLSNLLHLCVDCHVWVESYRAHALTEGALLHANEIPACVPVLTRHGLVLLTDEGTWRLA